MWPAASGVTTGMYLSRHTPGVNTDALPKSPKHTCGMGFLDRLKGMFDSGGIKVTVETEKAFRWSDDAMPIDLTVVNSSDEDREVTELRFQLVEFDRENTASTRKVNGRYEGLNYFLREPFRLGPNETRELHVDMPLGMSGAANALGADAPGWVEGVSRAVDMVRDATRDHEWYLLRVTPEVTGFTAKKIATRKLRNLRAGEWGGGMFTMRVGGE